MTQKQMILAAAGKQCLDSLPFVARIDIWFNYHRQHGTLPEKYTDSSMIEILRDQGAGIQIHHLRLWKIRFDNIEIEKREEPPYTFTEWRTPLGTVCMKSVFSPQEGSWIAYEVELPFKNKEDYAAIGYIIENTKIIPDLREYEEKTKMVGDDGMVLTGMDLYSPMQAIMRYWLGYERFFFELHDNPSYVEHLFELEKELARKKLQILAQSPVEIPKLCANWSDEIHTPVFKKYFVPWLREASEYFHSRGKLTQVHADGEMRRLIPLFLETRIDMAEAWTPSPMTSVSTAELRKAWGDKVTIWGGIPAVLFEPQYSDKEFDAYVINLFREIAPGYNFILGMGDNLPFDGRIERVGRVAELVKKYGRLPLKL